MKKCAIINSRINSRLGFALLGFGALLWLSLDVAQAAPKSTLPPGFHSNPLEQPEIESKPDPQNESKNKKQKPASTSPQLLDPTQAFLPLLARDLLLPPITGLLHSKHGLGQKLWRGSDSETIKELLLAWQGNLNSRPVADLAKRLLLTEAPPPEGLDAYTFMWLRLERLYDVGDLQSIQKVLDLYPALLSDEALMRLYQKMVFTQHIARGNAIEKGCALWKTVRRRKSTKIQSSSITLQINALCLGITGQSGRALASAERFTDANQAPKAFFLLLANLLDVKRKRPVKRPVKRNVRENILAPNKINNVLWALYKATGKRPRSIRIKNIEPALLPLMAEDRSLPYGWRLACAQAALLRGLVSQSFLQRFYSIAARKQQRGLKLPLRRNRAVYADRAQIKKISQILANAPTRTAFMASLYSWARDIVFLGPQRGYRRADGLRAALLLNRPKRMYAWLGKQDAADQSVELVVMSVILEHAKRSAHRGASPQKVELWHRKGQILIDIIGAEFFDKSGFGLPDEDDTEEGDAIMDAAYKKARAEVILRILIGMDNPELARKPSFLRAVMKGLREVGLNKEAWQIAVDSFLLESWGA